MREIFVEKCKNKQTLTKYILEIFPNLKYSTLQKALRNKDIRVNDKKVNKDSLVNIGDKLNIYINDYLLFDYPQNLDYVYKDENILAVYKIQGLLSNIENYDEDGNENMEALNSKIGGVEPTLESLVKKDYPTAVICHRLDRNTSGIVLFALNKEAYEELLSGFKYKRVKKEYIAYVLNAKFDLKNEVLENYILKDKKTGYSIVYKECVKNSQKIITEYEVLYTNIKKDYAILNVSIPTGKTHQIRAQMKAINHNIIGDSKYGINEVNKKFKVYKQLLFAYKYSFNFNTKSVLHYLNNIVIKLDNEKYMGKLGE